MSAALESINDDSFETAVLQAKQPVLVDFWASWCGPCKQIMPILEEVANTYKDKMKFVKLNVEDNQEVVSKFGVRGIPTLLLFLEGKLIATHVGGDLSISKLTNFIDSHI